MKTFGAVVLLIMLIIPDAQARSGIHEVREVHYQMGTLLEITIWHTEAEEARQIVRGSVREIHRLERILSHYDPESSLSLLNDQAGHGLVKIDPELYYLLTIAIDLGMKTYGYFDITVGPLMDLWRQAAQRGRAPEPHALAQAQDLVGYRKLKLYESGEAELARRGMKIDLGGIGKGYAVDRIVAVLKQAGVSTALINFGGSSIYALGSPPGEDSWKIGLKGPDGGLVGIVHLKDQALSTSGSMGHFWEIGGKRYGHLINPKDGLPVTEPRVATIVASTATEAEALTKPLILLGKKGMVLIREISQTEALFISASGEIRSSMAGFPMTLLERTRHP